MICNILRLCLSKIPSSTLIEETTWSFYIWLSAYTLDWKVSFVFVKHAIDACPSSCHASHQLEDSNVCKATLRCVLCVCSLHLEHVDFVSEIFKLMFFHLLSEMEKIRKPPWEYLEDQQIILEKSSWFCLKNFRGGRCYPWAGDAQCELEVLGTSPGKSPFKICTAGARWFEMILKFQIHPMSSRVHDQVVVSKNVYFHPYLGRWSYLTNIFQMGWNHQVDERIFTWNLPWKSQFWKQRQISPVFFFRVISRSWQTGNPVIRKLHRLRRLQYLDGNFNVACWGMTPRINCISLCFKDCGAWL